MKLTGDDEDEDSRDAMNAGLVSTESSEMI